MGPLRLVGLSGEAFFLPGSEGSHWRAAGSCLEVARCRGKVYLGAPAPDAAIGSVASMPSGAGARLSTSGEFGALNPRSSAAVFATATIDASIREIPTERTVPSRERAKMRGAGSALYWLATGPPFFS